MMEKHNIPVPPEPDNEAQVETADASATAEQPGEAPTQEATEAIAKTEVNAEPTETPVPAPRQEISGAEAAATRTDQQQNKEVAEEDSEEFEEDEEEEEEEEEEEHEEPAEKSATNAEPTPAPRQPAPAKPEEAKVKTEQPVQQKQAAKEEDNEEEEEEEEEDDMKSLASDEPNLYEVLQAYSSPEPDMLSIVPGEQLIVLRVGTDGWWLARNSRGHEGLVPKTLLREVEESEETGDEADGPEYEEDDEEEDDDDEAEEPAAAAPATAGSVPLSADQNERPISHNNQAIPGLPSGFRSSTLARWFYEVSAVLMSRMSTEQYPGSQFSLAANLLPKLAESCVAMQDGWCRSGGQIQPLPSRIEKLLQLQKCTLMPGDLQVPVLDRFIRLCLFDGQGPVSNIFTVRALPASKNDDRVWNFSNRLNDSTPGLEFGELYLRYNYASNHVSLLVEATIVCTEGALVGQQPIDAEKITELSIGHVNIPLCDENGAPLPANRSLDLQLEGGTPFEQQVEVESSLNKPGASQSSGGLFRGSAANKQPRIQLKFSMPSREVKEFMDTCPGTIIGSTAHLQLHSLYRHILGQELSQDNRLVERDSSPLYGPCVAQFPTMADQPDLMDLIRRRWNEFAKRDRAYRKPIATEAMKQEFIRIVKSVYLLNQLKDFQPYIFGSKLQEQTRANLIQDFQRRTATDTSGTSFSLSPDFVFEPFSMREVTLPILGPHSVPVIPVAVE